jgi:hypothetical protein
MATDVMADFEFGTSPGSSFRGRSVSGYRNDSSDSSMDGRTLDGSETAVLPIGKRFQCEVGESPPSEAPTSRTNLAYHSRIALVYSLGATTS